MTRYRIAPREAAELYQRSSFFRNLLASGFFEYTEEGCFRLRNASRRPRERTDEPRNRCIGFAAAGKKPSAKPFFVARKSRVTEQMQIVSHPLTPQELKRLAKETETLQRELPADFAGTVKMLMTYRDLNKSELAYRLGVDEKTLYRWLNNVIPSRKKVFALGFALGVEAPLFDDLLRKAGYSYTSSEEDNLIQMIRGIWPNPGLSKCNRILLDNSFQPLTPDKSG